MGTIPTFPIVENPSWVALRNLWEDHLRRRALDSFRLDPATLEAAGQCADPRIGVTQQRIWLDHLPARFRGFRIVHLSDIHHSLFFPLERVAAVVELCNRLKPDLVA